jgi:hypothetical protein
LSPAQLSAGRRLARRATRRRPEPSATEP